jgi:hypothetical protein
MQSPATVIDFDALRHTLITLRPTSLPRLPTIAKNSKDETHMVVLVGGKQVLEDGPPALVSGRGRAAVVDSDRMRRSLIIVSQPFSAKLSFENGTEESDIE